MMTALVITQFVGIPFTFLFGHLAGKIGAKTALLAGLCVYTGISVGGYFMTSAVHFFILATVVGMVQGGCQGLSRSIFSVMVPRHKASEFFGFFSTSGKMAGLFGPLVFAAVSEVTGQSRLSITSLVVFFVLGGLLLWRVNVTEGMQVARAKEQEMLAKGDPE
jgi:UMF1 family MFS transporter